MTATLHEAQRESPWYLLGDPRTTEVQYPVSAVTKLH